MNVIQSYEKNEKFEGCLKLLRQQRQSSLITTKMDQICVLSFFHPTLFWGKVTFANRIKCKISLQNCKTKQTLEEEGESDVFGCCGEGAGVVEVPGIIGSWHANITKTKQRLSEISIGLI